MLLARMFCRPTIILTFFLSFAGCAATKNAATWQPSPPSTQPMPVPMTDVDGAVATADYWYAQPAAAAATAGDFDSLWAAAEQAARLRLFTIDRRDPRSGMLVSAPMVSSQVFEPWRQDQKSGYDTAQSTLATIRRTIRFEIVKQDDGLFQLTPKVLVERYSQSENRVTSVVLYRGVFRTIRTPDTAAFGTRETDRGVFLEGRYWYATGRDEKLEAALAADVQKAVGKLASAR